jgi:hypothetical protein
MRDVVLKANVDIGVKLENIIQIFEATNVSGEPGSGALNDVN